MKFGLYSLVLLLLLSLTLFFEYFSNHLCSNTSFIFGLLEGSFFNKSTMINY